MTDKVQKIRKEVERLYKEEYGSASTALHKVLDYIDSLQEEPVISSVNVEPIGVPAGVVELANIPDRKESVSKVYTFKSIPRLLEMIQPSDRAKFYATKLAERLESEGYPFDATIVKESIKVMNGEKVAMATMDEKPVSKDLEAFIKERVKNIPIVLRSGFHELCRQLIRDGAQWQKNHVWHSPDEKPKEDKDILFLRSEAFIHNSMCYTDCNFCNDAMRGCDKWCYIADLED